MTTTSLLGSPPHHSIRRCRCCGHPFTRSSDGVVSSHRTSEGVVRYLRCPNGHLTVALS